MDFRQQTLAEFEAAGAHHVRLKVQAGLIAPSQIELALQWLREKDAEAAWQVESLRTQETFTAIAAKRREKTVQTAAIIAAISGVLSVLITALAWLFPRH